MADAEPRQGGDAQAQRARVRLGHRARHVDDAPAPEAREVVVVADIAVEARVRTGQLIDEALGDEQPEVPVHRPEAHAGQAPPHHLVDPFRGGMRVRAADDLQDHPARPGEPEPARPERVRAPAAEALSTAVFSIGPSSHRPFLGMVLIYGCTVTTRSEAVKRIASRGARFEACARCPVSDRSGTLSTSGGVGEWRSPRGSASREPARTT